MIKKLGSSERKFGLMFALLFGLSGGWLFVKHDGRGSLFLLVGILLFIVALFVPAVLGPFSKIWMKFGEVLHKVISPVVLGVIFFLVFTPIGIALRFLGKDKFNLRYEPESQSYWKHRLEKFSIDSFNNQF